MPPLPPKTMSKSTTHFITWAQHCLAVGGGERILLVHLYGFSVACIAKHCKCEFVGPNPNVLDCSIHVVTTGTNCAKKNGLLCTYWLAILSNTEDGFWSLRSSFSFLLGEGDRLNIYIPVMVIKPFMYMHM